METINEIGNNGFLNVCVVFVMYIILKPRLG